MLVKNRMTAEPVTVTPEDSLAHALRLTREHRVRHLPVVRNGELVGILSDRDIRLAMPSPIEVADPERAAMLERTPVERVMTREVITAGPFDAVEDAAEQICRHRIGALPVVDAHGHLLGVITETDVVVAFAEVLAAGGPSSRLEVSIADRPGELARLLAIIGGELKLNVTSLMVLPDGKDGRKTAVLHVATIDPREAIEALERAGATVGWPSLEADLRRGMDA
ncbi:CBS and ACT domain-containing protein [Longimicrobium sp.]|uniref:CBS and ACT domain-containing protein n=1 Tax=Longimicrobium sp. TaxID=2029185 RepID=UPI002C8BAA4A|nr:CBS and ACT domain-containing protein [Longimicrobium sp.]HSU14235.1 CBS and ACT domain-containing protein [Longimicrobium sp.]